MSRLIARTFYVPGLGYLAVEVAFVLGLAALCLFAGMGFFVWAKTRTDFARRGLKRFYENLEESGIISVPPPPPDMKQRWKAGKVSSFAIYLGKPETLQEHANFWEPVDVLVLRPPAGGIGFHKSQKKLRRLYKTSATAKGRMVSGTAYNNAPERRQVLEKNLGLEQGVLKKSYKILGQCHLLHFAMSRKQVATEEEFVDRVFFYCWYLVMFCGFDGIFFSGVDTTIMLMGGEVICQIIRSVADKYPHAITFTRGGHAVFERVRDYLHGVLLVNPTMNLDGSQRVRIGDEQDGFTGLVKKINTEIAIRNDFCVLAVEVVQGKVSPAQAGFFASFTKENNFVGWVTNDGQFEDVAAIKTMKINYQPQGARGLMDMPAVVAYSRVRAMQDILDETNRFVPNPAEWNDFLLDMGLSDDFYEVVPSFKAPAEDLWPAGIDPSDFTTHLNVSTNPYNLSRLVPYYEVDNSSLQPFGAIPMTKGKVETIRKSLKFLFAEQKLLDLGDAVLQEFPSTSWTVSSNRQERMSHVKFVEIINTIENLLANPSPSARHMMEIIGIQRVSETLGELRNSLEGRKVNILVADKGTMTTKDVDGIQKRLLTTWDRVNDILDIYVAGDVPSVFEVVLHSYFRCAGYSKQEALVVEGLPVAQASKLPQTVIAARYKWQISWSSKRELVYNVTQTLNIRRKNGENETMDTEAVREYNTFVANQVDYMARRSLLQDVTDTTAERSNMKRLLGNRLEDVEQELRLLVGEAILKEESRKLIVEYVDALQKVILQQGGRTAFTDYCHDILWNAVRRVAAEELVVLLRSRLVIALPDYDQCSVALEMIMSRDRMLDLFSLDSHEMGALLYEEVRAQLMAGQPDDPDPSIVNAELPPPPPPTTYNSVVAGFFFSIPAIMEILLNLYLGSGIFSSQRFQSEAEDAISLAFMVTFIVSGGVINSIARVCTYYIAQNSIPVMVIAAVKRVTGGLIAAILPAGVVALGMFIQTLNPVWAVVGAYYSLVFSVFFIFLASLFVMRQANTVLVSTGPQVIVASVSVLLISPIVMITTDLEGSEALIVYMSAILVATTILACSFRPLVRMWLLWPTRIEVTSPKDVTALYTEQHPKPTQGADEDDTSYNKRCKRWERAARVSFAYNCASLLKDKNIQTPQKTDMKVVPPLIKERMKQKDQEFYLMDWYFLRSGQKSSQPYSFEWDSMLKQALKELKKKFAVEKLGRGGVLAHFEADAILYGAMYFVMIFLDRWSTLLTGYGTSFFLPSNLGSDYAIGLGWATVYMLTVASLFEINLVRITFGELQFEQGRLFPGSNGSKMINFMKRQKSALYWRELATFLTTITLSFVFTSIFIVAIHIYNVTGDAFRFYIIGCVGYTGLLTGLFHKLFLAAKDAEVNAALFAGLVVGLLSGIISVVATGNPVFNIVAILVGGWVFGIASIFYQSQNLLQHNGLVLSPALMSSGCKWMSTSTNLTAREALYQSCDALRKRNKVVRIDNDSPTGDAILTMFRQASASWQRKADTLLLQAFPDGDDLLRKIGDRLRGGHVRVFLVDERIMTNGPSPHFAVAQYSPFDTATVIYVGAPIEMMEDLSLGRDISSHSGFPMICETIIHELLEMRGMPHTHASISELLLYGEVRLPSRMQKEIGLMNDRQLLTVLSDIIQVGISKASMDADVSTNWMHLGHGARRMVVTWAASFMSLGATKLDRETLDTLHSSLVAEFEDFDIAEVMQAIGYETSVEEAPEQLRRCMARSLLGFAVAKRVYKAVRKHRDVNLDAVEGSSEDKDETIVEMDEEPHNRKSRNIFNSLKATGRIIYMCFTADTRFGREMHDYLKSGSSIPFVARYTLPYFYISAKALYKVLLYVLAVSVRPFTDEFVQKASRGLYREEVYSPGSELSKMIHIHESASEVTAFVKGPADMMNGKSKKTRRRRADSDAAGRSHGSINALIPDEASGGTLDKDDTDTIVAEFYQGRKEQKPSAVPFKRTLYDAIDRKLIRQEWLNPDGNKTKTIFYEYESFESRYPSRRVTFNGSVDELPENVPAHPQRSDIMYYDNNGLVVSGDLWRKRDDLPNSPVLMIRADFTYSFQNLKKSWFKGKLGCFGVYLAQASYTHRHQGSGWNITIVYEKETKDDMILVPNINYVDFSNSISGEKHRTFLSYTHPQHPTMTTMLLRGADEATGGVVLAHRQKEINTPYEIRMDVYKIIHVPGVEHFFVTDIFDCGGMSRRDVSRRLFDLSAGSKDKVVQICATPYGVMRRRFDLWKAWRSGEIEGVFARELDEQFLRETPILKRYWRLRDRGDFKDAVKYLEVRKVAISTLVLIPDTPQTRTHLKIRLSDMMILGAGGDAADIAPLDIQEAESVSRDHLQVLGIDSGTWPTGGGGVGNCRRDLIKGMPGVRWTIMAEIGTDAELLQPGYDVEKNVNAIYFAPLWGLDFATVNQNVLATVSDGELERRRMDTTDDVVSEQFVPLLRLLIRGSAQGSFTSDDIERYSLLFVRLNEYFQKYDWLKSWDSEFTKAAWFAEWFEVISPLSIEDRYLTCEMPSLNDLDMLYSLIVRLLYPFASKVPVCPVIQASHHGIQALLGMIAKRKYGSRFIIWDHGILWRERIYALANVKGMAKFVQIGFMGLTRLAAVVNFGNADYICPCTSIQNIDWEAWLGGGRYNNDDLKMYTLRKISPVLNGMDMGRFRANFAGEEDYPCAVMLSHVNSIKDVMNAIQASSVIVHDWGLTEFRMYIYGSLESDPSYAAQCANTIVALDLSEHVRLMGLGNPQKVLSRGWVFVNSSFSEGLPLALGEAGLCGLPVVCTDVGGSREVLSDTIPGQRLDPMKTYGRVVPPASSSDLAKGIMEVMGMTDDLENIVDRSAVRLTLESFRGKPAKLLERMMDPEVRQKRRALGLRLRARVFRVFGIHRYLREHEQLMWVAAMNSEGEAASMIKNYIGFKHKEKRTAMAGKETNQARKMDRFAGRSLEATVPSEMEPKERRKMLDHLILDKFGDGTALRKEMKRQARKSRSPKRGSHRFPDVSSEGSAEDVIQTATGRRRGRSKDKKKSKSRRRKEDKRTSELGLLDAEGGGSNATSRRASLASDGSGLVLPEPSRTSGEFSESTMSALTRDNKSTKSDDDDFI
eukprot:Clim_evm66s152 gene=Clim_evmTU66s152